MAIVVSRRPAVGLARLVRRPRSSLISLLTYGGLSVGLVVVIAPFAWMVLGSFKTREEMARLIPTWLPEQPTLDNYRVLIERLDLPLFFANSVLVAAIVTAGNVIFCSMAGYALAKLNFPGRRLVFGLVLATLLVPGGVTLIPSFILVSWLGLANTYAGLTLPFLAGAFGVFFVRQAMLTLPDELLDAARVDGASEHRIFWAIALPLSAPAVATLGILTFLGSWNGFLWPLVVAQSERLYTLPVALATFSRVGEHHTDFGLLMAGSVVIVLPILLVFLGLQRYITRGLAMTGLKG